MNNRVNLNKLPLDKVKEIVIKQNVNPLPMSVITEVIESKSRKKVLKILEKWINPLSKENIKNEQ